MIRRWWNRGRERTRQVFQERQEERQETKTARGTRVGLFRLELKQRLIKGRERRERRALEKKGDAQTKLWVSMSVSEWVRPKLRVRKVVVKAAKREENLLVLTVFLPPSSFLLLFSPQTLLKLVFYWVFFSPLFFPSPSCARVVYSEYSTCIVWFQSLASPSTFSSLRWTQNMNKRREEENDFLSLVC